MTAIGLSPFPSGPLGRAEVEVDAIAMTTPSRPQRRLRLSLNSPCGCMADAHMLQLVILEQTLLGAWGGDNVCDILGIAKL